MAFYPTLKEPEQSVLTTQVFYGYDHNPRARDGAFYNMENMSGRSYPLITTRRGRKIFRERMTNPSGLIAKDQLYWVDSGVFYAGGNAVNGFTLKNGPKQLVSMGAYIVIWPDKKYINTQDLTDYGSIDNTVTLNGGTLTIEPAMQDGTVYDMSTVISSSTAPAAPENGALWIDTSGATHIMNRYNASTESWVQIPTVYLKITAAGIGAGFSDGDGVTISGLKSDMLADQVAFLNADTILHGVGKDYLLVVGILDQVVTIENAAGVKVARQCPDMDYICESNNRLWGCYYGLINGKPVNEIYASKLGDFRNWRTYAGLSTDSYAVSVGTDGVFTGAVNYQGYPMFFKETCIHRVYGNQPSSYQMQTSLCRGVEKGSAASLCQVGEVLYYKGRTEVLAYDGSVPQNVGQALGDVRYSGGVGGSIGNLYYLSMLGPDGEPNLFVYDAEKAMWYREDMERPLMFAQLDDDLFFMTSDTIKAVSGGTETDPWRLDTAVMGYEYPEQKYLSRWLIRASAEAGQAVRVFFQYDSSGEWEPAGEIVGQGMASSFLVPVIPRRCDHMQLRLEGEGEFKLFSLSRVLEKGGDPIC